MSHHGRNLTKDSIDLKDSVSTRPGLHHIPQDKLMMGSLKDRIAVKLDDGRTTVYVKAGHNIKKVKKNYETYDDIFKSASAGKKDPRVKSQNTHFADNED